MSVGEVRKICCLCFFAKHFGQAKIENLYHTCRRDFYIRWFDIAVNDAAFVCHLESFRHLPGNLKRFIHRNRTSRE